MTNATRRITLGRVKMLDYLREMDSTSHNTAISIYISHSVENKELDNYLTNIPIPADVSTEISGIILRSATGAVIFQTPELTVVSIPPFPVAANLTVTSLDTGPIRSLLEHDYLLALVLVRLGSYAIGVCRGEELVSSKVGTGLVHGRHKKGGSSAHRFERHRDKQIEYFLTRVCQRSREQLEPYVKSVDYVVFGGARTTIQLLQKQCAFLGKLEIPTLPPLLDIPEPRQAVLKTAVSRVWTSLVYEWRDT